MFEHLNIVEKDYFGLRFVDQSDQTVSASSFKISIENKWYIYIEIEIKWKKNDGI